MIDTHTHLYSEEFNNDRDAMIQLAFESGVEKMLMPNIDIHSIEGMHAIEKKYTDKCFAMMGLHPCSVKEDWQEQLTVIKSWLDKRHYVAIGEIGIDLYWDKSTYEIQEQAFRLQIEWAKQKNLPIVIHVRNAFDETFKILDELNDEKLNGVFHCFSGNLDQANHVLSYGGFKLGIGGVVTFKNGGLDLVLPHVDLSHFVLETDSPYLAPAPFRGKRNQSSYLKIIAQKIAELKKTSFEEVNLVTTQNALSLFSTAK